MTLKNDFEESFEESFDQYAQLDEFKGKKLTDGKWQIPAQRRL